MRRRWFSSVFVLATVVLLSAPATAQTIAYTNFLAFDLQSYRSQATGGMFDDDIENVADAARLMNVEGNRLFTSFSNLADPAGFGDNVLSYSVDHAGAPTGSDHYDTGSYLVGWIGKYDKDSEYNFSAFYQRNSARGMFENLNGSGDNDAEHSSTDLTTFTAGTDPYDVSSTTEVMRDYTRYSQRSATDFDLGAARDMSEDLSVGGRVFFEKDQLDYFSNGTWETVNRTDHDADPATPLRVSGQTRREWFGNGEEAYKYRNMGVSLNTDYHAWDNQSVGVRLDIAHGKETNPGFLSSFPSTFNPGPVLSGVRVDLATETFYGFDWVEDGDTGIGPGANPLSADRVSSDTYTFDYSNITDGTPGSAEFGTESVDDERSGLGFALKGEYNREWGGGDINSWAGFGRRNMSIDATRIDARRTESRRWWNDTAGAGTGTDYEAVYQRNETSTTTRSGDATHVTFEAGGRWNRDLNSHVSLGIGGVVTRMSAKEDYEAVLQQNWDEFQTDGAAGANALYALVGSFSEDTETRRETTTTNVVDETKATMLRLPVGIQFHFKDRWTFNMGVTHTQTNVNSEVEVAAPAGQNGIRETTTYDAVADVTTTTRTTREDTGSETTSDKWRTNHTTYWYGIAVDITDAVQLDVNGFFDTNSFDHSQSDGTLNPSLDGGGGGGQIVDIAFWRNLAISLKFIFW